MLNQYESLRPREDSTLEIKIAITVICVEGDAVRFRTIDQVVLDTDDLKRDRSEQTHSGHNSLKLVGAANPSSALDECVAIATRMDRAERFVKQTAFLPRLSRFGNRLLTISLSSSSPYRGHNSDDQRTGG